LRHSFAALSFALCATAATAEESGPVYHVGDAAKFGRPTRIVVPEYPGDALAKHVTGYVDLQGQVSPLKSFTGIVFTPGTPEAALFVEPLREVIKHWEFEPVYRNGCFPADDPVKIRVNFEIEDGKPRIFVTMARSDPPKAQSMSIVRSENPVYPRSAMRAGLQAFAYARMEVAPDGSVGKVDTEVYPQRAALDNLLFENELKHAFSKWRFNALPDGETRVRVACQSVFFRLKD
jgi:outer membrane biosynthesis protein TonB